MSTIETLTHHLTAFGSNDLIEIMEGYSEESEVLTPEGPLRELTAIRGSFEAFFAAIPTGSAFP